MEHTLNHIFYIEVIPVSEAFFSALSVKNSELLLLQTAAAHLVSYSCSLR